MSLLSFLPAMPALGEPATILGAIALAASCTWPMLRRRQAILMVQVAGSLLFALHYLLLGAPTAAAMCATGVVQGLSVILITRRPARIAVVGVTVAISLVATTLTWTGLPSLLSQGGQLAGALGRLQLDTQRLRLCFLGSVLFWCAHNITVGSVFGLASDTLALTGLLVGLWRHRRSEAKPAPAARPVTA